jgi:hypothetical protein
MQKRHVENLEMPGKDLADAFNASDASAKKCLSMSPLETDAMDSPKERKKRDTPMDGHASVIFKMPRDIQPAEAICAYARQCVYDGNPSALPACMETVEKNNFPGQKAQNPMMIARYRYPDDIVVVNRFYALKYVPACNAKTPLGSKVGAVIELIKGRHPVLAEIGKAFRAFRAAMMGDPLDAPDAFLKEYGNSMLKPFCDGMEKDVGPAGTRCPILRALALLKAAAANSSSLKEVHAEGRSLPACVRSACPPSHPTTLISASRSLCSTNAGSQEELGDAAADSKSFRTSAWLPCCPWRHFMRALQAPEAMRQPGMLIPGCSSNCCH